MPPVPLSPREEVADTLHTCILGLDTNDRDLFSSAFLHSPETSLTGGGHTLTGIDNILTFFERAFAVVTTHFITNIRVDFPDGKEGEADLTCHAIAYHIRPEEAMSREDTSHTAGCLYELGFVKAEGSWKIKRWNIKTQWTTGDIKVLHPDA